MTIRKKLLLSHLCMIFIPILLAAAAGIGLFHVYGSRYWDSAEEMLGGISHDLRTPLTSIKGYAEGLQEGIANTEEKRRRYCRAIHTCALEMEGLLDSLSTFSRLENKSYQYKLEMTDLDEYLSRLTESHKENLSQWGAALFYENRADRTRGKIDRQEMQRVFANLFENSVKYRTKGSCTIHVTMENRGNDLLIRVADDGPGVPEQELENIFHIFYRGDASRAKTENGSGLGLAIVRRIVEGHNGTIKACNDGGLVMEITLPLA